MRFLIAHVPAGPFVLYAPDLAFPPVIREQQRCFELAPTLGRTSTYPMSTVKRQ